MKILLILVSIILVGLIIAGGWFWYMSQQPLYTPGQVRAETNLRAPLTPPVQESKPNFWQMEADIQLYHEAIGTGRTVLIIHGGPGTPYAEPWSGLTNLIDEYQFHYYHQRGSGLSSRPIDKFDDGSFIQNVKTLDHTLGIGAQLADIERIRQLLGEEKLIIIGHSFGGFLASLYAAEFPEHVAGLILVAPADLLVMPLPDKGLYDRIGEELPPEMQADYQEYSARYLDFGTLFEKSEAELVALNHEMVPYFATAIGRDLPQFENSGGWMPFAMFMSMGQRHDYRQPLTLVEAPVLVIHGVDDLQTEAASRKYADQFPDATFHIIEDATHFPFSEQPEQFGQIIASFLERLK